MICGNSFIRLLREDLKRRTGSIILCVYVTILGVAGLFFIPDWEFSIRCRYVGPGNGPLFIMNILWALLLGFSGFSYLFSRKKADFYFTIPVSRKKLFLASYLNGIFLFFILNTACRLVIYAMVSLPDRGGLSGQGGLSGEKAVSLSITALGMVLSFLTFLFLYHLVIICCTLAGNALMGAFIFSFFCGYGELWLSGIITNYNRYFFHSFYRSDFLKELLIYFSPVRLCGNMLGAVSWKFISENDIWGNWLISNHMGYLNVVIVLAVLTFFAAFYLFKRRAAENAQKALAFDQVRPVLRLLLVIPAGLLCGYGMCQVSGDGSMIWLAGGMAAGILLTHGLLETWFHFDGKAFFHKPLQMAGAYGCGLLVVTAYLLSGNSYDSWLPSSGQIESMAISIRGLDTEVKGNGGELTDSLAAERLDVMALTGETKENACRWIGKLIMESGKSQGKEAVEPFTTATVAFHMTDGTTDYRRYGVNTRELLEDANFDAVYRSVDYRTGDKQVPPMLDMYGRNVIWSNGAES